MVLCSRSERACLNNLVIQQFIAPNHKLLRMSGSRLDIKLLLVEREALDGATELCIKSSLTEVWRILMALVYPSR